ncbi:MAG TPA: PH domain-containing protein [Thermomicrobiales bacterium]|nr:PH domain-containing protein [Thermomicrobiales bacterium]
MPDHDPQSIPREVDFPATAATDDLTWHRMSARFIFVGTVRQLRGLVIPAALILVTGNMGQGRSELIYIGIATIITVIAGLGSLAEWWNFRYALADRELVVRSGIVQKQERAVPYGRIQAINVNEAPLERLVGIVRVKVETAAGGTGDIEIRAVPRDDAPRLREALATARTRAHQSGGDAPVETEPDLTASGATPGEVTSQREGELIRSLSTRELLELGATSGRIGPMAAVVGAALQFGAEIVPETWWDRVPWQEAEALRNLEVLITLLLVIAVVTWLLAIASTALTFGGFELRRSGDQLLLQHGLLDRRRRTIPIQRIQAIVVSESPLRQPFHRAEIRFESAGGEVEGGSGDSGALFPYLPLKEVEPLLQRAAPEFATDPTVTMTTRLPARAMRRYITAATVGWLLFVGIAAFALALWLDRWITLFTWRQVLLLLLLTPVFAWLGWARWRDGGWRIDGPSLVLRWRGVARETLITRTSRIQRREMTADPLQRRADLATVHLSVASGLSGGHYALPHAEREDAERLLAALSGPRHLVEIRKIPIPAEA